MLSTSTFNTKNTKNLHRNTIFIFSIISFLSFIAFLISLIVSYSLSYSQEVNSSNETQSAFFTNLGTIWIAIIPILGLSSLLIIILNSYKKIDNLGFWPILNSLLWIFMIIQTKSFNELKIKKNYFNLTVISIIYFILLIIGFGLLTYSLLINNPVSFYITIIIQLTFWMDLFIYSYSLNKKRNDKFLKIGYFPIASGILWIFLLKNINKSQ